jgi:rhamnose transport system permease protein
MSRARRFLGWEALLAVVLLALIAIGIAVSPVFLSGRNFTNLTAAVIEVSIMALPMALIIIAGEIDLSVESMAGLSCAVVGVLWQAGVPIQVVIPIVLLIGAAGGLLNGVLVTSFALPSLVVTLGTLALFRGLALVVLGSQGVAGFPDWFTSFGFGTVPGTPIPWPLLIFAALAIALGTVLHTMWPGRRLFAIGKNASAARYSGVGVARTKLVLFAFNGVIAALAGVILTARFASARADIGQGLTLTVITIVLLGGVNIFGGRGTIPGVVLAAATLAVLGNVLRLTNVSAEIQSIAVGVLLIVSVVIPNLAHQVSAWMGRGPRAGRGSAATAGAGGTAIP